MENKNMKKSGKVERLLCWNADKQAVLVFHWSGKIC